MLSLLKGRINGKDPERAQEALSAKNAFEALTSPSQKCTFLEDFIEAGKGKKPGSLAFVAKYTMTVSADDSRKRKIVENYYTRQASVDICLFHHPSTCAYI